MHDMGKYGSQGDTLKINKLLLLVLSILLIVPTIYAYEVSEFSNGLTAENITFTGSQDIIRYMNVPRYTTITQAYIYLNPLSVNYDYSFNQYLYNKSVSLCQNLSTPGIIDCVNSTDQNDNTYASVHSSGGVQSGYIYVNYTIDPQKSYNFSLDWIQVGNDENYRIYFNCWQGSGFWPINDAQFARNRASGASGNHYFDVMESCIFEDTLQMRITLLCEDFGVVECDNKVNNLTLHEINVSSVNFNLGEQDSDYEWNITKSTNINVQVNVTEEIDDIIKTCTCANCSYSNSICNVPFIFHSDTNATLQYSDINVTYDYNNYNVTINIFDSETLAILSGVNITVQYIGSEVQREKTTINGQTQFNVNVSTVTDDASLILFETLGTEYSIVSRYITFTQGENQNISIYMTNTTDSTTNKEVTFITKDENRVLLEGAVIKIYKRDPDTNQFLEVNDLTTNPNGEATTSLVLNNAFYKFVVLYQNRQVYVSTSPYPISSSDDTITLNCIIGDSYSDYYVKTQGFDGTLQFTETSNVSGYYTITWTSVENVTVCLNSSYITNTVFFDNGKTCDSGTSGVLNSNIITVTQLSDIYSYLSLDFGDSEGEQVVRTLHNYLGLPSGASNVGRLILLFGIVVLSGVAFIYYPIVGLIVFGAGVLILALTKFTLIDIPFAMFIICLVVFVIYVLKKNEK